MKTTLAILAQIAPACVLLSCAAPKATVVGPLPPPKLEATAVEPASSDPAAPSLPDDGIRLPDMLAMPGDGEFRATSPRIPLVGPDASAVIVRPPTDPPPRPKPKEKEQAAEQ